MGGYIRVCQVLKTNFHSSGSWVKAFPSFLHLMFLVVFYSADIAPCLDDEFVQFPLRMRDWLKNVLLQLYEQTMNGSTVLNEKQRARVQKIYESQRVLRAGEGDEHPVEVLAKDFEKNYNMYIYPVHWQFAQVDQHPADRSLSRSELAPLRLPLVPMEHCISHFFTECDVDKDKLVSFQEWCRCFAIKYDMLGLTLTGSHKHLKGSPRV
uniref:EF-hand domain-containing protein n=1 Tax=Erpetoichthys calabaricus TaxID=27687 RepID=A0A8C4SWF2_ERPCA